MGKYSIQYSGRKITASFVDRYKLALGREGETARRQHIGREREHNPFLVLYDVKQFGSGCRTIATDRCE
jgi:hypothetical protein